MPDLRVGAVILAAGRGIRFGSAPKMLAKFRGEPLVRHAAKAALGSLANPVVAVVGAHGLEIGQALHGLDIVVVDNPRHAEGLSTSLHAGLTALGRDADAVIVLLGDMPHVRASDINVLVCAYRRADPRPGAVVPVHDGQRGNPVVLDLRTLGGSLSALTGDRGAGPLLAARHDVLEMPMDASVLFDVDVPESLAVHP